MTGIVLINRKSGAFKLPGCVFSLRLACVRLVMIFAVHVHTDDVWLYSLVPPVTVYTQSESLVPLGLALIYSYFVVS